jgi:hypothetical protein
LSQPQYGAAKRGSAARTTASALNRTRRERMGSESGSTAGGLPSASLQLLVGLSGRARRRSSRLVLRIQPNSIPRTPQASRARAGDAVRLESGVVLPPRRRHNSCPALRCDCAVPCLPRVFRSVLAANLTTARRSRSATAVTARPCAHRHRVLPR